MKCSSCGTELPDGAKFCFECGEKLAFAKEPVLSADEIAQIEASSQTNEYTAQLKQIVEDGLAVERRDVAVLFADISGYSALFGALSSLQVREVMRDVYSVMSGAITRCGGYVDNFIGDEVMAIFGAPIALERPCERAITAVDEIEIGLTGVNYRFKDVLQAPLSVHAGIAFGQVEAGKLGESKKLEYTVLGETVNLAKRLTDAAFAKTVFVSSQVKRLTDEAFEFDTLGVHHLQGISDPQEVFRLKGPKAVTRERIGFSDLTASMFGRDEEFDLLTAAFVKLQTCYPRPRPCKAGEGKFRELSQIFGIAGDAGIGKSRLKRELRRHIREKIGLDGVRFLAGGSWCIGRTPLYWPIKEQIASAFGFDAVASSNAIRNGLAQMDDDGAFDAANVPYIFHLFGLKYPGDPLAQLDPKAIKGNLWVAIRKLYERWSLESPLVLAFEDMHWADDGTREFVEYLAEFVADFPVLVLLLYRTGYEPKFVGRLGPQFVGLELHPLSGDAETGLLSSYLATGQWEQALITRLKAYSQGNPLFVEEFLHLLLERNLLEPEHGKMCLTADIEDMPFPSSLSGILHDRFNLLTRDEKHIAYYAALIGRSFSSRLLSDMHGLLRGSLDIQVALRTLQSREVLFEKAVTPELEYIFKHSLTRDMLASRLVESLRRELSKLLAMRIEELYKDRLDEFHSSLSEYYEVAGDHREAARHAALWAIHEQKQHQNSQACCAFDRYDLLTKHLDDNPLSTEQQADLLRSRITVLSVVGQWDKAIACCHALIRLADGLWGHIAQLEEARLMVYKEKYDLAMPLAKKALVTARQVDDQRTEARSAMEIANIHRHHNEHAQAIHYGSEALSVCRELGDKRWIARSLHAMGVVEFSRGELSRALEYFEEALSTFEELKQLWFAATAMNSIGAVHMCRDSYDQALWYLTEALSVLRELGELRTIGLSLINVGNVYSHLGDCAQALECLTEGLSVCQDLGMQSSAGGALNAIGVLHKRCGDYQQALRHFKRALSICRELSEHRNTLKVSINLAEVHRLGGDFKEALQCNKAALAIAQDLRDQRCIAVSLSNEAIIRADMGEWREARKLTLEANRTMVSTDDRKPNPERLSILCRAEAGLKNWEVSVKHGADAISAASGSMDHEHMVNCRMALAEAHLLMARWYDGEKQGDLPPLSRDEALAKTTDYANQAKELAEAKGLKGFVKKAEDLLADIDRKK